jgi:hypothetical protein
MSGNPTNQGLARHGQGRLLVTICGYDKLFTIAHRLPGQTCYSFARVLVKTTLHQAQEQGF